MMKKKIWISILGIALVILAISFFSSTCIPTGEVTLCYQDIEVTLTPVEAELMREIFSFKFYNGGIGGCPYEEDVTITFGNKAYAIAMDGCYTAKEWHSNRCIEFNRVEFGLIKGLFEKYCGKTEIG